MQREDKVQQRKADEARSAETRDAVKEIGERMLRAFDKCLTEVKSAVDRREAP